MAGKVQYKTKHREEIIAYLESIPGKHVTVNDIMLYFRMQGKAIGAATIYRQMERLVEEGIVNKYFIDENSSACFEYVGDVPEHKGLSCFHCKCEKCGKLIHLECGELQMIREHLAGHHGFDLDPFRTVFYGVCNECKASFGEEAAQDQ
mgnify:CR=1 FL=1